MVIVPPKWAHATFSADPNNPLTFGAWSDLDYGFEYEKVRKYNDLVWFPLLEPNGELMWVHNPNYGKTELTIKRPNDYSEFNIKLKESIYQQYENDPDLFLFVPEPYLKEYLWEIFIPCISVQ